MSYIQYACTICHVSYSYIVDHVCYVMHIVFDCTSYIVNNTILWLIRKIKTIRIAKQIIYEGLFDIYVTITTIVGLTIVTI